MLSEPQELAPGFILINKGTHEFDVLNRDGLMARYHQVTSSVTLYLGPQATVIDSGARIYCNEIEKRISKYIEPDDVQFFIATHYHHDHLDNSNLFANATRILDTGFITPGGVMTVFKDPSLIPSPEGVEIFGTPGHVKHHISARIIIDNIRYVCAGDAIRQDILEGHFRPAYVDDEYISSARLVFKLADIIIPGHGDCIEVDQGSYPELINN